MCGIAGIFFKNADAGQKLGRALVDMLDGCQHRGFDSTGFALYEKDFKGLRLRFIVDDDAEASVARIKSALAEQGAKLLSEKREGASFVVEVDYDGEIRPFAYAMEHAAKLVSIGSSLDIIKDVGTARDLDGVYHIRSIAGSHGVGHVRLATEFGGQARGGASLLGDRVLRRRDRPQWADHQLLEDAPEARGARLRVPHRQRQRADRRLSRRQARPGANARAGARAVG